ncbi:MAG TPA: phosphotransferase family protein [Acidimicrobiia bacterium]|nr:phosphotransferase family protein [Acidimicrobiia bacterium]
MAEVEGIAVNPVSEWIDAHVGGFRGPYRFDLVAGGRSNLTFIVTDASGRRCVLRRPPTSHVLPTAHDMGREYRIIHALGPTAVPVPPALGLCTDEAVNGRPFYVMGFVEGHVLRDDATALEAFTPDERRIAGEHLVDVLADLHAVDVDAVGLGDLGRKEAYIERQLKRWYGQYQQSAALQGRSVPAVDEVHDLLAGRIPPQGPASVVHGDYRLDNTVIGADARVAAVLDWEICTLGDPLADVGQLMVNWVEPGDTFVPLGHAPTLAPGFPSRVEVQKRYAARSGRDLSNLDFYVAFGYWKLACILEGVFSRYAGGAGGGDRGGVDAFAGQIDALAVAARETASRL